MNPLAIYIHWPFCLSKCPYCDFNSRPLPEGTDESAFAAAYLRELDTMRALLGERQISSLYFGGGTPSLMQPQTTQTVLDHVAKLWPVATDCEITLEANPSSSETEKFKAFRSAGINRLSLGVQSFDDEALRFLGRAHDAAAACRAIESAASVFDRFSFDLIYARVGQSLAAWEAEIQTALSFRPKHLSLYQLTIEPGTVFFKKEKNQSLRAPDEEAAAQFEFTQAFLAEAGLPAYEISNHAAPGQESRHNLTYWHYEDYIGIGPGAHGRFVAADGLRYASEALSLPTKWLAQVEALGHGRAVFEAIDQETAMREALMMGLRLTAGLARAAWAQKFELTLDDFIPRSKRTALREEGLVFESATHFAATAKGREKLNALSAYLLA